MQIKIQEIIHMYINGSFTVTRIPQIDKDTHNVCEIPFASISNYSIEHQKENIEIGKFESLHKFGY